MDSRTIRQLIDENFSLQWCHEHMAVPLRSDNESITIGVANIEYLNEIGAILRKKAGRASRRLHIEELPDQQINQLLLQAAEYRFFSGEVISETEEDLDEEAIAKLLLGEATSDLGLGDFLDEETIEDASDIDDLASDLLGEKIKQAVAKMLIRASQDGASDIHIEPYENHLRIRFRIDGVLKQFGASLPRQVSPKITAVIKVMAGLDVAEKRSPQDGRILRRYHNQKIELRVSTMPVKHGEKTVMRLLNSNQQMLQLDALMGQAEVLATFREMTKRSYGIIFVAGPTGSGKSTTLYSAINEINEESKNIVTAEDPIEYTLPGIQQVQVLREKGMDFPRILRAFLRQDPDVMLVGETRDPETAKTAMEAALTGHLVFTTIHANTAAAAISRLREMGIESHIMTSSMLGVLAQRLVRRLCPSCSLPVQVSEEQALSHGLRAGLIVRQAHELNQQERSQAIRDKTLCPKCQGRGYSGRIGIYELMKADADIKTAISQDSPAQTIEAIAVAKGMLTLNAYGLELVKQGLTTLDEVQRVCSGGDE